MHYVIIAGLKGPAIILKTVMKKLNLKTLKVTSFVTELDVTAQHKVQGGSLSKNSCVKINETLIPTHDCIGYYPSLNAPCINI